MATRNPPYNPIPEFLIVDRISGYTDITLKYPDEQTYDIQISDLEILLRTMNCPFIDECIRSVLNYKVSILYPATGESEKVEEPEESEDIFASLYEGIK